MGILEVEHQECKKKFVCLLTPYFLHSGGLVLGAQTRSENIHEFLSYLL